MSSGEPTNELKQLESSINARAISVCGMTHITVSAVEVGNHIIHPTTGMCVCVFKASRNQRICELDAENLLMHGCDGYTETICVPHDSKVWRCTPLCMELPTENTPLEVIHPNVVSFGGFQLVRTRCTYVRSARVAKVKVVPT